MKHRRAALAFVILLPLALFGCATIFRGTGAALGGGAGAALGGPGLAAAGAAGGMVAGDMAHDELFGGDESASPPASDGDATAAGLARLIESGMTPEAAAELLSSTMAAERSKYQAALERQSRGFSAAVDEAVDNVFALVRLVAIVGGLALAVTAVYLAIRRRRDAAVESSLSSLRQTLVDKGFVDADGDGIPDQEIP